MTDLCTYAVWICPVEHINAMSRVMNVIYGDTGNRFGTPASATGQNPPTHGMSGDYITPEIDAVFAGLATALPEPAGGWPFMGVTEAEAEAAVAALDMTRKTCADADIDAQCIALALSTASLIEIQLEI